MPIMVRAIRRGIDRDHPRGMDIILPIKEQQVHLRSTTGEQAEIHTSRKDSCTKRKASAGCLNNIRRSGCLLRDKASVEDSDSHELSLLSSSFAAATTSSGSKPNFLWSSLSGAEEPNVFMPMTRPDEPTYRSHPKVDACSTATRAFTFGGSTKSRYSCVW